MLQRAAIAVLTLAGLAACTDPIVLKDIWGPDASASTDTAVKPFDAPPAPSCDPAERRYGTLDYSPHPAPLILLLDRSQGMQEGLAGGPPYTTRESAAQFLLSQAASNYQASIALGFESFPLDPSDPTCESNTCCAGEVSVSPSSNNGQPMQSAINCTGMGGGGPSTGLCPSYIQDSPWHLALGQVRDAIRKAKYDYPRRYLLLVTASEEPSCFADTRTSDACEYAKSVVNDLGNSLDTRLYVISVGYQPDQGSCLSRIGQTSSSVPLLPGTQQSVYVAADFNELNNDVAQVFDAIAQRSCTVTSSQVAPGGANMEVVVGKKGKRIPQIDQADATVKSGWYFSAPNNTSITFAGEACTDYLYALFYSAVIDTKSTPAFFSYYTCAGRSGDQGGPQP
jgi:hypothetical protein